MLVVGEASGDVHGANLVNALHRQDADLKIFGVAGEQLQQTDFEALFNVSKLTGMPLNSGSRYFPSTDVWVALPGGASLPAARDAHSAISTGTDMVV